MGCVGRLSELDGDLVIKYMLLVHHDEKAFVKFSEATRQQMLEESVQLTHQLHTNGR
jgi:hypothetical protein